MKINHSTSNSFKGLYIIKGTGREVNTVISKINKKCSNKNTACKIGDKIEKTSESNNTIKDFKKCYTEKLTGIYGDKQPIAHVLIATNDDIKIIENYYSKLLGISLDTNMEEMDEVHLTIFKNRVNKFFKTNLNNFVEYQKAQKKCIEHGDASSLASFTIKQVVQAKKKLAEILSLGQIKDDVKTLRANEVLEAINNNSFDFNTGIITNKKPDSV